MELKWAKQAMNDPCITLKTRMAHLKGEEFSFSPTLWPSGLERHAYIQPEKKWLTTSQLSEKRYDKTIILFPLSLLRLPNIFLYPATSKKYEDREGKEHMRIRSHTLYLGGVTHLVLSSRKKRLEELLLVLLLLKV